MNPVIPRRASAQIIDMADARARRQQRITASRHRHPAGAHLPALPQDRVLELVEQIRNGTWTQGCS